MFINIFNIFIKEFKNIISNSSAMLVIIGGNILYAFLYPTPYLNDIVTKQNISIVDDDNTQLSRELIFNSYSTPQIKVYSITSMQEAKKLLEQNKIYGILHIPSGFEKDAIKASVPKINFIADASYFLIYSTIIEGLNNASKNLIIDIKSKQALYKNININEIKQPIKWEFIPIYNPSIGYMDYALSAIFIFILYQTILIACGIIGGGYLKQFYKGETKYLIENNKLLIILARIFVFFIIYIPIFLFYFGFIYDFYNIDSNSNNAIELLCFGIVFLISSISFGIFIGSIFNRGEWAIQIVVMSSMPILFALGFIWPIELIPNFIQSIMIIFPITPALDGFLKINQMGATFDLIKYNFIHLLTLILIYILISYIILIYKTKNA